MALLGYVLALVGTLRLTQNHVRPLFEGIGPAPPYRWVDPPREFAVGNVPPTGARRELTLGERGSGLSSLASGDAQVVVNLPEGAVPPKEDDTIAAVTFDPLSPKDLAPPPAGLVAAGNAYRITISYGPSGQAVDSVVKAGNIVMALPHPGVTLLWSTDGKQWERLATQAVGAPTTLGTRFVRSGYYLGASTPIPPRVGKSETTKVVALIGIIAGLALALGFLPMLFRRIVWGEHGKEPEAPETADEGAERAPMRASTRRRRRRKS